jgi:hypothetical protein
MKIAIFGDSFADETYQKQHDTNSIPWARHLRTRGYDIDNYGQSCASLIFSYQRYLENKHKYTSDDLAIFLVTSKGRLWLRKRKRVYPHISGINHAEYHKNEILEELKKEDSVESVNAIKILESIEQYYRHIYDEYQDSLIGNSLLRSILLEQKYSNVFSNMLFIPCFESFGYQIPNITGDNITIVDNLYLHEDIANLDAVNEFTDHRLCHMNPENSEIFANMIEQWITTGKFNVDKNKFKSTKPWYNKILESV